MTPSRLIKSRWFFVVLSLVVILSLVGVVAVRGRGGGSEVLLREEQLPESSVAASAVPGGTVVETSDQPSVSPVAEQQDIPVERAVVAAEGESSVLAPDKPGPYHIGYYSTKYEMKPYGVYYAAIYYPARHDGWLAAGDASGGPYPGIVVSNGYYGSDWNIIWLPRQLASHGYVSICFTPPTGGTLNTFTIKGFIQSMNPGQWAEGFRGGIDKLKEQNGLATSPIRGLLDVDTFGVIGLSMGGAGSIEAAGTNPEVDAAVGLAPAYMDVASRVASLPALLRQMLEGVDLVNLVEKEFADVINAAKNIKVPTQLQVGTNDGFIHLGGILGGAQTNLVQAAYEGIPDTTRKEFLEIKGGSHAAYLDSWVAPIGNLIEGLLGGGYKIPVQEQHRIAEKYFISWFNYYLKGQTEYGTYIFGPEAQKDVSSGVLSQLQTNVS